MSKTMEHRLIQSLKTFAVFSTPFTMCALVAKVWHVILRHFGIEISVYDAFLLTGVSIVGILWVLSHQRPEVKGDYDDDDFE